MVSSSFQRGLNTAGIPYVLEPRDLAHKENKTRKETRPDGKTLLPWAFGKPLVWDVTVVDTVAPSYVERSSEKVGSAAEMAEDRKIRKYAYLGNNYHFVPIALETFGVWGDQAETIIKDVGKRVEARTGEIRSLEYLRQRISIDLQRGNAACVLGTLPNQKGLDSIFFCLGCNAVADSG